MADFILESIACLLAMAVLFTLFFILGA